MDPFQFLSIFHEALEHALRQGRKPVVCLLGPDMQAAFDAHSGGITNILNIMGPNDILYPDFKPGDIAVYAGVRLRQMNHDGMAMLTA